MIRYNKQTKTIDEIHREQPQGTEFISTTREHYCRMAGMDFYARFFFLCWTFSYAGAVSMIQTNHGLSWEEQKSPCGDGTSTTSANYDNNDPICIALNDERTFPESFFTTALAPVVVGLSGGLSALGSLLIMLIILRSSVGLSTVLHRLVFAMSLADFISSIAMGAGTLPIPKDTIYGFQGAHLGNEFTCSLQGFLTFYGGFVTICYNACIAVYYMCTITFKMRPTRKEKCLEPIMHALCHLATLPTSILFWINKWFNPSPFEPFCVVMTYPYYCRKSEDADQCSIRGKSTPYHIETFTNLIIYYLGLTCIVPFIILISMITIIVTVGCEERALRTPSNTTLQLLSRINMTESRMVQRKRQRHEYTKRIAIQALFYVLAGLVPQIGSILRIRYTKSSRLSQFLYTVMRPCQGLLNFMVFFGQKVSDVRQIDPSLTLGRAGMMVLRCKDKPHFQFSGVSLVGVNAEIRRINVKEPSAEFDDDENENAEENNEKVVGVGSIRSIPSVPLSTGVDKPVSCGKVTSASDRNSTVDRLDTLEAASSPSLCCAASVDVDSEPQADSTRTAQFSPSLPVSISSLATPSFEPVMEISLSGSNDFLSEDTEGNADEEGKSPYYSMYRIYKK
jgi:hypothetical protein